MNNLTPLGKRETSLTPEVNSDLLVTLMKRISDLESRLYFLTTKSGGDRGLEAAVSGQALSLDRIRHGIQELTTRMEVSYVMSPEFKSVVEVLDTLAKEGACNSIILEGEPGTGKTQWAYSQVGQEIKEGRSTVLVHIRVKDTMNAQDLLYTIDEVRRLSDAQTKVQLPQDLQTQANYWKFKILSSEVDPLTDSNYLAFKSKLDAMSSLLEISKDLDYRHYISLGPLGEAIYQSSKGKKVYVILDEIEKGREELMTGILDELENLTFSITETGSRIAGVKSNMRIVITTNSEGSHKIPNSFRRRSLYHYLRFPGPEEMAAIVKLNFPTIQDKLLKYALDVFYTLHSKDELQKKPSTPELLAWVRVLIANYKDSIPKDLPYPQVLLKYFEDQSLLIGVENLKNRENHSTRLPNFVYSAIEGGKVFRLNDRLNNFNYQESLREFYTKLHAEGIDFITPNFEERQERDRYGDWNVGHACVTEFSIIAPGYENLGGGYCTIPDEIKPNLVNLIDQEVLVLPANKFKLEDVIEKNFKYTLGSLKYRGKTCKAFEVDGKIVLIFPH